MPKKVRGWSPKTQRAMKKTNYPFQVVIKGAKGFLTWNAKNMKHVKFIKKDIRAMGLKGKIKVLKR